MSAERRSQRVATAPNGGHTESCHGAERRSHRELPRRRTAVTESCHSAERRSQTAATEKSVTLGVFIMTTALEKVEQQQMRKGLPEFRPGDTVRVHVKIKEGDKERIQVFEGAVIRRRRAGSH